MSEQHCFETAERGSNRTVRLPTRLARRQSQHESRKQRELDIIRQKAVQIRALIAMLDRAVSSLDDSINAELERAQVRDATHFAYPIYLRAMTTRRKNLKATIIALSEGLAPVDQAKNGLFVPVHAQQLVPDFNGTNLGRSPNPG